MADKKQIIKILDEMGTLLELQGDNPFRVRAYRQAAQALDGITEALPVLIKENRLTSLKGIGKGLAEIITEIEKTGSSKQYMEMRSSIPEGVLELLQLNGLGPKKVRALYEKLKIESIAALKKACENKQIQSFEGFGAKTEENILKSIKQRELNSGKFLFPVALSYAERIVELLTLMKGVRQISYAGSLRRRKELIGDIDIVASVLTAERQNILNTFVSQKDVEQILGKGETKASIRLKNGIQCDLRLVTDAEYPFTLNYFTGSKEHNIEIRSLAKKNGWSLNEYGFTAANEHPTSRKKKPLPKCNEEVDLYAALGLQYIPPEIRENSGEIEYAKKHPFPNFVQVHDLAGTFHCHTTDSDGVHTLEQMVDAAKKMGWNYLGIADHSQSAKYAGGLSQKEVRQQIDRLSRINEKSSEFYLFAGTECDILSDGSLDYPDSLLSEFDYVVISIHSKFQMTEKEATKRVITALKNKYTTVLGHPTGRLLLEREPYPLNIIEVINAASDYGKAIEINSHPSRLDLDWRYLKYAKEKGVPIFINPDAHSIEGLADVQYGVGIARKGWLEAKDIVNTWSLKKVKKYLDMKE